MEEKKNTTAYGSILNDIKELKDLVMKMYTVAAFYGDDESAQKGYEVADDFSKKVGDLEKNFLEKASFIGNQISYGDFDEILTEKGRLKEEILEYLDKDDKEKNATRERYIQKIEEIGKTVENKSTEESWDDLREIVEDWRNEFKDNSRFEVLEYEINKSISKATLMILENQAQSGEKVDLNPVDEVCSRDALLNTVKEKFIEKGKDATEIEKKREYFEIAQNLTEKRLSDSKVWEQLVGKESVKVEEEQTKAITKQKNISKPKETGLFERFRGKTIYTFGDIDPDTGEWINVEEVRARYPQILSKKQADRLLKIEINGVRKVKKRDFQINIDMLMYFGYAPRFKNLQEVIFGDDVKEIEPYTFSDYSSLKNVKIGEGITCLPEACFEQTGLKSVEIPGNVETIGEDAFKKCRKMKKVILKKGMKRIQANCFGGTALEHITIPDTVEIVNEEAFWGLDKDYNWYIPNADVEIAEGIKIKLSNYLALFQKGRLDKGKLKSLIEGKKTKGNLSKDKIDSLEKQKEVAMEDENSGKIMEEIEKNKERQNPNFEKMEA